MTKGTATSVLTAPSRLWRCVSPVQLVRPSEQRRVDWVEVELLQLNLLVDQAMLPIALLVEGPQLLGQGTLDILLLIRELTLL